MKPVVYFTSELLYERSVLIAKRIFADSFLYEIQIITDELSDNPVPVEKENQAIKLYDKLFDGISDGDDTAFRERLLYSTPYYFKDIIADKDFFDDYWAGGFDNFAHGIGERDRVIANPLGTHVLIAAGKITSLSFFKD